MDNFLDPTSRQEIRNVTNECLQEGESPLGMAGQWFTPKRCERLQELLDATDLPDTLLVACHAWLEVHELDQVAYLPAENRKLPRPYFANFNQTAEEVEADLRFVNAV